MADAFPPKPKTIDEIFKLFESQRAAIITALTSDLAEFMECCTKDGDLCLYAEVDGSWRVGPPPLQVPSLLPEPLIGINHPMTSMPQTEWLYLVAIHSDSWLLSLVSFYAAGFSQKERREVMLRTCDLPTVYQVVARKFPRATVEC